MSPARIARRPRPTYCAHQARACRRRAWLYAAAVLACSVLNAAQGWEAGRAWQLALAGLLGVVAALVFRIWRSMAQMWDAQYDNALQMNKVARLWLSALPE